MKTVTGQFCWNELAVSDVKKAKDFYGKVFGWQFIETKHNDVPYIMIKSQEREFGGIWQIPSDKQKDIPPHWMAYILVNDAESALEKAKQNGAKVIKEVTTIEDLGSFAIITDPSGAHVALWEEHA